MTDESKPKVVEPWIEEACAVATYKDIQHRVIGTGCICEIIASAFARSRSAGAAGEHDHNPFHYAESCRACQIELNRRVERLNRRRNFAASPKRTTASIWMKAGC